MRTLSKIISLSKGAYTILIYYPKSNGCCTSLENTPNDLWRGQAEALNKWHSVRKKDDVLVSLNTGAGKTIVGLLIAQSLVNEDIENVIYVCSTIDLAYQTAREADRIGISYTLREKNNFNNDLFESGKAFCITTYSSLFNGYSTLRRKFFPGAAIFDDAHVAESLLRNAFTIKIDSRKNKDLFNEIAALFKPYFQELGISELFKDSLSTGHHSAAFVAPGGLSERNSQLLEIFHKYNLNNDEELKYPFVHLKDHIKTCGAIFMRGIFELAPAFLPSLALDIFERSVKRIYLSATLQSETEFIRAFGRQPSEKVIPSNDAGNGERLIIYGRNISRGFLKEYISEVSKDKKIVIAVPSYVEAEKWETIVNPPKRDVFSEALNAFKEQETGAFILVSRVDGIDLPHDTCRLMLIDGLPAGSSLIEEYQWKFLKMNNVHATRIANRLAQLFGRINRGRSDYGVFLIEGKDLNTWLTKDRNVSLLPMLLQKQIVLGRTVQEEMGIITTSKATEAINAVLHREQTWLDYYEREVKLGELDQEQIERATSVEPLMIIACLAEAKYAAAMWNNDYTLARQSIEESIDNIATIDTPLAGWHSVWLGAAFDLEEDLESANRAYSIARSRLGTSITLPQNRGNNSSRKDTNLLNKFGESLESYVGHSRGGKSKSEIEKLRKHLELITSGSSKQSEAAVRTLGEALGFSASRPDNDQGTGPDVIWIDEENKSILGFELKTDKNSPARYKKDDICQGHDHISWMKNQYSSSYTCLGLLYIGPDGTVDKQGNPSDQMGLCIITTMGDLRNKFLALLTDLMSFTPNERLSAIAKKSVCPKWTLKDLARQLKDKDIISL